MSQRNTRAPAEFRDFASLFNLSLFEQQPDEATLIEFAITNTAAGNRSVIKGYLDELLVGQYSNEDLQRIWFDTGAGLYFPEGSELRLMLKMMRDAFQ